MAVSTRSAAREDVNFSSLPTELRLMVWEETFEPRILHITTEKITLPPNPMARLASGALIGQASPTQFRFKAREPPPIALSICRESRALAQKYYTLSFHSFTNPHIFDPAPEQFALYFNPELDTVHVDVGKNRNDYVNLAWAHKTTRCWPSEPVFLSPR